MRGAPAIRPDPEITDPDDDASGVSSVLSESQRDAHGRHVLYPTVKTGGVMTPDEAWDRARAGHHLGVFDTPAQADAYAERLHLYHHGLAKEPPHMAMGGDPGSFFEHGVAMRGQRELFHPGGLIKSSVAGRTDRLPISVAADSYVLPADVVSGLGEGNSLAGAKVFNRAFKIGPWGTGMPRGGGGGRGLPRPPAPGPLKFAQGGPSGGTLEGRAKEAVKIIAAGGEYIVPPDVVAMLGGGDAAHGHDVLDALVKKIRAQTVKTLKKLPGPKKD